MTTIRNPYIMTITEEYPRDNNIIKLEFVSMSKLLEHHDRMTQAYPDATIVVEQLTITSKVIKVVNGEVAEDEEKFIDDSDYDHVEYMDGLPQRCKSCGKPDVAPPSHYEFKIKTPCCDRVMQKSDGNRRFGVCGCGRQWRLRWDDDAIRFTKVLTYQEKFDNLFNKVCGDDEEKRVAMLDILEQYDHNYRSGNHNNFTEKQGEALAGDDWGDLNLFHGYRDR